MAVAVQVHKAEVGVSPIACSAAGGRSARFPVRIVGALVESRRGAAERDQVQLAVAGQVENCWPPPGDAKVGDRWPYATFAARPEPAIPQIRLVEPGAGLLGQDPGEPSPSRSTHR